MLPIKMKACFVLCALLVGCGGCNKKPDGPKAAPSADEGKKVYAAFCIACHNGDPAKDGAIGPAVKGSSKELLEARVLRAAYPPGYAPKRDTHNMVALPHLADKLDDLYEYLK